MILLESVSYLVVAVFWMVVVCIIGCKIGQLFDKYVLGGNR